MKETVDYVGTMTVAVLFITVFGVGISKCCKHAAKPVGMSVSCIKKHLVSKKTERSSVKCI